MYEQSNTINMVARYYSYVVRSTYEVGVDSLHHLFEKYKDLLIM